MAGAIVLHGRSLSGKNLELVKKYGVIHEIIKGRDIPAIVIAPQTPKGAGWDPDKILNVVEYVQKNYHVDTSKLYVAGMSMGGYGTMFFVGKYPQKVTAAVAICGGGKVTDGCNLKNVPMWIMHGKRDKIVPMSESEKMVKSIRDCGGNMVKFTIYDSYDHGLIEKCFRTDTLYNWLFAKNHTFVDSEEK